MTKIARILREIGGARVRELLLEKLRLASVLREVPDEDIVLVVFGCDHLLVEAGLLHRVHIARVNDDRLHLQVLVLLELVLQENVAELLVELLLRFRNICAESRE